MDIQALQKISELDVFSLLVFKLTYETGFANFAAKELSVSPAKISRCLTSLRSIFNDELFYRRQQGLKPTPLAEILYQPICQLCEMTCQIERLASQHATQNKKTTLQVAVSPNIISSVAMAISHSANLVGKIKLHSWQSDTEEQIYQGELDFGIGFMGQDTHDLAVTPIAKVGALCVVGAKQHAFWNTAQAFKLEDIIQHRVVYLCCSGFNNRIDPLELYCQTHGLPLDDIDCVKTIEEWYWHILTMNSLSLTLFNEGAFANNIPQLRVEKLPASEFAKLDAVMAMPHYCLIERDEAYRRYSLNIKQQVIQITQSVIL
ncbi:LysR family transcriptional regulator [Shewanella aestuarii]|uniref:LysR family transcriptional regulator n=1 Tax=Shewanella aestuarii TaxID=1028752 RepID=A0A6G9QLL0_9GAMM|nr:LysR family transcriptional regulator [Shewanella aestuarii]QIR15362.1 LysR family transcriptional regulator [Shewanella aestuarii]